MKNPRKTHVGKSPAQKNIYRQKLKRPMVIEATYELEEDITTDSPQINDENVKSTTNVFTERHYSPENKKETDYKKILGAILQTVLGIVVAIAITVLSYMAMNLNREVGELSQKLEAEKDKITRNEKNIQELKAQKNKLNEMDKNIALITERINFLKK